jgi:hypothetical protein
MFHSCIASCLNGQRSQRCSGDEIAASSMRAGRANAKCYLRTARQSVPGAHTGRRELVMVSTFFGSQRFSESPSVARHRSLWLRRSSRGSDGLRRLPGSSTGTGAARTARPSRQHGPGSALVARSALVECGGVGMPVMVAAVVAVVSGDPEAGEEDRRDDEQDAGHDHHPCREPVQPIRFNRFGRRCGGRVRRGWGFRCFSHASNDARPSNSRS